MYRERTEQGGERREKQREKGNLLLSLCKYGINVPPFHLILHLKLLVRVKEEGRRKKRGGGEEGGEGGKRERREEG